ncbi:unannotated protein [freshwater metagenome]|uniref:Unannotated protein n=1 Tax=freshwater metagenome TaxID=449393 RepID=A0A6J7UTN8_9ZZZZ
MPRGGVSTKLKSKVPSGCSSPLAAPSSGNRTVRPLMICTRIFDAGMSAQSPTPAITAVNSTVLPAGVVVEVVGVVLLPAPAGTVELLLGSSLLVDGSAGGGT